MNNKKGTKMNPLKKLGLDQIISEMKAGLNPAKIAEKYSIPKQTLNYSLDKLKKLGCIEKRGYGTWKVLKQVPKVPKGSRGGDSDFLKKQIRGHAFIWRIEFVQPYDWFKTIKAYKKKKLSFILLCNKKVPRVILNNRKIWLTRRGLTIYEPLDFMGRSSFEVKGMAVYEMDKLIKKLIRELGLKFKQYRFTTSREHYGLVKNELARQYNDRKEKMIIRGEDGTAWLWIDDSKGLSEIETNEPNVSRQVQNFWNGHKKHNFKVDADFILKGMGSQNKAIKKNADNLGDYAKHLTAHVQSIKDLGAGVEKQNQLFERIARTLERLEK